MTAFGLLLWGCSLAPDDPCGPFPDWRSSALSLPYPVGEEYEVNQANCSGKGHSGFWLYGYDFSMPVGAFVTAARPGRVVWALDGASNGDHTTTNLVVVEHADMTVAVYSHLSPGLRVSSGEQVSVGDTLGRSGNTGNTGGFPHLHFSIHPCADLPGLPGVGSCVSQPATFRNVGPNAQGLQARQRYRALP